MIERGGGNDRHEKRNKERRMNGTHGGGVAQFISQNRESQWFQRQVEKSEK